MVERQVKIPEGSYSGLTLRYRGEGEAGLRGGGKGDLNVVFAVRAHPIFERDDLDLHYAAVYPNPVPTSKKRVATILSVIIRQTGAR